MAALMCSSALVYPFSDRSSGSLAGVGSFLVCAETGNHSLGRLQAFGYHLAVSLLMVARELGSVSPIACCPGEKWGGYDEVSGAQSENVIGQNNDMTTKCRCIAALSAAFIYTPYLADDDTSS